jgi:hypothetical protein
MLARLVLVPAFLILLPAGAFPQQLGDAAAREREKKAKAAPPAKAAPAFSNDDLASEKEKKRKKEEAEARGEKVEPESPAESTPSEEGHSTADGRKRLSDPDRAKDRAKEAARDGVAQDGVVPEGNDDQGERSAREANWRGRFETARKTIREMEGRTASIQARLDELRARISPMNQQPEQDINRLLAAQQEITTVEAELELARTNLKTAREELVALEETARQAGVPPGWLRPSQ